MKKLIFLSIIFGVLVSCSKSDDDQTPRTPTPTNDIPLPFSAYKGLFGGEGVGAAIHLKDDVIILFNQSGNMYAWFEDEEIKGVLNIDDAGSIFRFAQVATVGAGALTAPNELHVFDKEGENFTTANFDPEQVSFSDEAFLTWASSSSATATWGEGGSIGFNLVSAMWRLSDPGEDCFDATLEYDRLFIANETGDFFQPYTLQNGFFSDGPTSTELWLAQNNCGGPDGVIPLETIGAACQYVLPNKIMNIFFSADGTQMCFYTLSEGEFSEIYDLY